MRTLGNILQIVSREGPLTIAREAAWRASRRWRRYYFMQHMKKPHLLRVRKAGYYQPSLDSVSSQQRGLILQLADEICRGRIPFLSYRTQEMGLSPAWNRDFIGGKVWPCEPSSSLPTVGFDGSDVKVPWELSRLQFLPVLGKAYCLTRESKYRDAVRGYLEDWIEHNPVGCGVNWMLAMEAALRGLSVLFTLDLLWPFTDAEGKFAERITQFLWQHLLYIEGHLEFSHIVRGNHYLSNLLGLYGLAVFLDGPRMETRRRLYKELLEREILVQTYADGGNYEASTGYHVLVAQMFLTGHRLMRAEGVAPSREFVERLKKMFTWMETLVSASGVLPHIGDCDDGRVEFLQDDLEQMAFLGVEQRDSLRVPNFPRFGKTMLGVECAGGAPDGAWFGLKSDCPQEKKRISSSGIELAVLNQSGIAVAKSGSMDLLFVAMPNGIRGKGSHTHNDKLSVILRFDGKEVLCDPGTGCYTRDGKIRNSFRTTTAHNTVRLDSMEQNRIPEGQMSFFSLGNEAQVSKIKSETSMSSLRLEASHRGYNRQGVIHTRIVELSHAHSVEIEDRLAGRGKHKIEAVFHLAPGWTISGIIQDGESARCSLEGSRKIIMNFRSSAGNLQVEQNNSAVSLVYGTMVRSMKLRVSTSADLPASLITTLSWDA